ncbi:MAG: hypothetical protein SFX73_18500 [Kofleriaceae bacterium]|nr:hypothetical protein [Kofleriaceae bacterium]
MTDDRKKDRPDPFAPLPLKASLTGKTAKPVEPPAPVEPPVVVEPQRVVEPAAMYEPPSSYEPPASSEPPPATYEPTHDPPPSVYSPAPYDAPPSPDLAAAPAPAEPLLPPTYSENDLRLAVGATPRDDAPAKEKKKKKRPETPSPVELDDETRPKNRKAAVIAALGLFVGTGIVATVFIGRVNSGRFRIACEANRMVVERGRSFPPWGMTSLGGAEWKPLEIPPEAECHQRETEDTAELATWYSKALVDQATALLTAREVTKVDEAEAQLKQALLVTRSLGTDDERTNARTDIERLLGDVGYWRASAKLRTASDSLTAAAKEFDIAAAQRPRHVTDASAWATFARKLVDDLKAGPAGAQTAFPPLPPADRPAAPPGVALPVEPVAGTGSGSAVEEPVAEPPDAGVPTGGVLL